MRGLVVAAIVGLGLAGCQTDPNFYTRDDFRGNELSRLRVIHDGHCTIVANNTVRGQSVPYVIPPAGGTSFVSGTYNGRPYSGTVTHSPNAGHSFASGVAAGAALGDAIREGEERRKIHKACMFANGWREKTEKDM